MNGLGKCRVMNGRDFIGYGTINSLINYWLCQGTTKIHRVGIYSRHHANYGYQSTFSWSGDFKGWK